MIQSMTGYGKGQADLEGLSLTVEIKSVNHRYCDITVKAPRALLGFEAETKKRIGERLRRGKIDVFINHAATSASLTVPTLNRALAAAYMDVFQQMQEQFPVEGQIPLALLAAQKDVVTVTEGELDEKMLRSVMEEALEVALVAHETMRKAEGEALGKDIEARLTVLEESLAEIEARAPSVAQEWQAKLDERLARLRKDFEYDPQRVAQEIAIFADRCDISEEVTRFQSHLKQFRGLFDSAEPVGRQMDFLVQELNREVNTMGSKSNDAALTSKVVAIKAELEKIREQVQNIQ